MRYRTFGRLGWRVSEVGYGMWGMAGWAGSDDDRSREALREAVRLGVNFFDTAWAYGDGKSERLLGELLREESGTRLYTASKVPPKNRQWPAERGVPLDDAYPPDHVREYAERTLDNLKLPQVDLLQFHTWNDEWARDDRWARTMEELKRDGLIAGVGISVNRWEPENGLEALRTGIVDAVQVVYNVFDQAPEDELFPLCEELRVAVIARVPFDEGSLTGTLTKETRFAENEFRSKYFGPDNLGPTVDRVEALRALVPDGMTMPEMALRFILGDKRVSTVIPGMMVLTVGFARMKRSAISGIVIPVGTSGLRASARSTLAWRFSGTK